MNSSVKGLLGEMRVAAKLMELGYPVFRSLHDISFDLLVRCVGDTYKRIEVRTVSKDRDISTCRRAADFITDVDFFIGVSGESLYVIPFDRENVRRGIYCKKDYLNRWDLLPEPYAHKSLVVLAEADIRQEIKRVV